jgi:large repetitive protein
MSDSAFRSRALAFLSFNRPLLSGATSVGIVAVLVLWLSFCGAAQAQTSSQLVFLTTIPANINAGGSAGFVQVAEETSGNAIVNRSGDTITITVTSSAPTYSATYTATTAAGIATFNLEAQSNVASQPVPYLMTAGNASATYSYSATGVVGMVGASLGTAATATQTVTLGSVYVVDLTTDPGTSNCSDQNIATPVASPNCTYHEAVTAANANTTMTANANGPRITIVFAPTLYSSGPATITLTATPSNLSKSTAVAGPGPANLILSGNNAVQPMKVTTGPTYVALSGFTITKGTTGSNGGAFVENIAGVTVTFNNMAITNSTGGSNGGAVEFGSTATGPVTITNSTFTGNSQTSATATGGALYFTEPVPGTLTVTNSYFASNSSSGTGGAIGDASTAGAVTLINDTFYNNTAVGSAANGGGGVFLQSASAATTIISCTVVGNSVTGSTGTGAGFDLTANLGKSSTSPLTVYNSVFEDNTIVAGTGSADLVYSSGNPDLTLANNQFSTSSVSAYTTLAALGVATPGNYGGPTFVAPILPGSVLIGAGAAADSGTPATDQRGFPRPATSGGAVDIGAVQSNLLLAYTVQPTNTSVSSTISPSPTVSLTDTGYGLPGSSVSVSLSPGTLSGGSTTSIATNSSGLAVFSALTPTAPEVGTVLDATAGSLTATSSTFNITGSPAQLAYGTSPAANIVTGGNAGSAITVNVQDSGANNLSSATNAVTLTVTGPSSYSQTYGPTAAVSGVATFNLGSVTLNTAGVYTYTATASGLTSATAMENVMGMPTIVWSPIPNPHTFDAPFSVASFVSSNSPGAFTYSISSGPATINSTTGVVTLTGPGNAGTVTVGVTQAANGDFTAVTTPVTTTFSVLAGSVWLANFGNSSLSNFDFTGTAISGSGGYTGGGLSTLVLGLTTAFDSSGNIWVLNTGTTGVSELTGAGVAVGSSPFTGGGINGPAGVAVDGLGKVWIANGSGSSLSELSNAGTAITPSTGYASSSLSTPTAVGIDISGNIWLANGNNSVTEIIGGAAPAAPLATAVGNGTTGVRP